MAGDELTAEERAIQEQSKTVAEPVTTLPPPPAEDPLRPLFDQRMRHRSILFWFCIVLTAVSFLLVSGIVGSQIFGKLVLDVTVFDSDELKVIVGSIFVQILGLLFIIAKALWNDKDYLPFMRNGKNQ